MQANGGDRATEVTEERDFFTEPEPRAASAVAPDAPSGSQAASLAKLLVPVALICIVGIMWIAAMSTAGRPAPDGTTLAGMLRTAPPIVAQTPDEGLFLVIAQRMAGGEGYYPAAAQTLAKANEVRSGANDLRAPTSFRLPTWFWLVSRIPQDGISLVVLVLAFGTAAVLGGYALARQIVPAPAALLAAAIVAVLQYGVATHASLLDPDAVAGALALVAVALAVRWRLRRGPAALGHAAAAVALSAALLRELAVPFILLGLALSLVAPLRSSKVWASWAAALAAFAAAYVAHAAAVRAAVSALGPQRAYPHMAWFDAHGRGLEALVQRLGNLTGTPVWIASLLLLLGLAGAVAVFLRDRSAGAVLLACALGGPILLTFLHPVGETVGSTVPIYWADVLMPTILACAPLTLAFALRTEVPKD
jgi:hypothetical protein